MPWAKKSIAQKSKMKQNLYCIYSHYTRTQLVQHYLWRVYEKRYSSLWHPIFCQFIIHPYMEYTSQIKQIAWLIIWCMHSVSHHMLLYLSSAAMTFTDKDGIRFTESHGNTIWVFVLWRECASEIWRLWNHLILQVLINVLDSFTLTGTN